MDAPPTHIVQKHRHALQVRRLPELRQHLRRGLVLRYLAGHWPAFQWQIAPPRPLDRDWRVVAQPTREDPLRLRCDSRARPGHCQERARQQDPHSVNAAERAPNAADAIRVPGREDAMGDLDRPQDMPEPVVLRLRLVQHDNGRLCGQTAHESHLGAASLQIGVAQRPRVPCRPRHPPASLRHRAARSSTGHSPCPRPHPKRPASPPSSTFAPPAPLCYSSRTSVLDSATMRTIF